jgi:hypothetical protein
VYWSSVSFEIGDSFVSGGDPVKLHTTLVCSSVSFGVLETRDALLSSSSW